MLDLIIKNGSIIDGSGQPPFIADIAVKDGSIVNIAQTIEQTAKKVIDAQGKTVTPGFIDIHRHSDAFVFKKGFGEVQIRQGITTTINGNCGLSVVPCPTEYKKDIFNYLRPIIGSIPREQSFETFSEYLEAVERQELPINFGMHIGNGTLRMAVKGFEKGEVTDQEYDKLHTYLKNAIDSGAFGVSMGVVYMPENMYDFAGFIRALEPIRDTNIPIVTHIRGEGDLLIESIKEVVAIAKELNVPLHISHYKCVGSHNWGHLLQKATHIIEQARKEGLRITMDVYPWTAGSTQMVQLLPPECLEGGTEKTLERLKDPESRAQIKAILEKKQTRFENLLKLVGWNNIMVTTVQTKANQKYVGKRITQIAQEQGKDPYDTAFDLLIEENLNVAMVNFIVSEEDIETIIKDPTSAIISDSIYPDGGMPHPRQYGTFAKVLEEYVKEKEVLKLEEAIRKITGYPAQIFNIPNKGLLKKGYDADIVIFELDNIKNHADYVNARQFSTGFDYVFVNGVLSNKHDEFIKTNAGKVLRRGL